MWPTFNTVVSLCCAGKGDEQVQAATALMLLCIQLGVVEDGEAAFRSFQPTLVSLLLDPSASLLARAQVPLLLLIYFTNPLLLIISVFKLH